LSFKIAADGEHSQQPKTCRSTLRDSNQVQQSRDPGHLRDGDCGMLKRFQNAIHVALFACIVAGYGVAVWSSQSPQPAINQIKASAEQRGPNQQTEDKGQQVSPLRRFWNWTTHDPVAFYTSILSVATIGLGIATIGLYLAAKKQIAVASEAADAAGLSAKVAAAGLLPAIQIVDVEMSKWTEFTLEGKKAFRACTTLVLSNNGGGQANILSLHTYTAFGTQPPKDPEPWEEWPLRGEHFIPSRGNLRMQEKDHQIVLTEAQREQLTTNNAYLYYWGRLRYSDFFGDHSELGFIWRYREADQDLMASGWRQIFHPNHTYHRKLPKSA
jgi:hypothetical protein